MHGDGIRVYNGVDVKASVLQEFCGATDINNQIVVSTGPYMFVEFWSDDRDELQGFSAEFEFTPSTDPTVIQGNTNYCKPFKAAACEIYYFCFMNSFIIIKKIYKLEQAVWG